MVGSCDVKFPIRLEGLAWSHGHFAQYEPELFPGLIYRMQLPKIVLLIFVSGKIVLTGGKNREDIYKAFENIYPVLTEFRKLPNPGEEDAPAQLGAPAAAGATAIPAPRESTGERPGFEINEREWLSERRRDGLAGERQTTHRGAGTREDLGKIDQKKRARRDVSDRQTHSIRFGSVSVYTEEDFLITKAFAADVPKKHRTQTSISPRVVPGVRGEGATTSWSSRNK
jgi:hypothetical protein